MSDLRLVKGSRFDAGCFLLTWLSACALERISKDYQNLTDAEILEQLARVVTDITKVERYMNDPRGYWA